MSKNEVLEMYKAERQKCLIVTRVMGYLRPTESFNTGKQGEYNERKFFTAAKTCCNVK